MTETRITAIPAQNCLSSLFLYYFPVGILAAGQLSPIQMNGLGHEVWVPGEDRLDKRAISSDGAVFRCRYRIRECPERAGNLRRKFLIFLLQHRTPLVYLSRQCGWSIGESKAMKLLDDAGQSSCGFTPARELPSELCASAISVVPFYPNLYRAVKSIAATLLLTYLEIHHPAPQDGRTAVYSLPVSISMDQIAADLQVSRRTVLRCLSYIATWYKDDCARWSAARAGREFLQPGHKRFGTVKPYSVVGPRNFRPGIVIDVRRNRPYLARMLQQAGIVAISATDQEHEAIGRNPDVGGISIPSLSIVTQKRLLAEILLRGSVLAGDRRKTRYERLRRSGVSVRTSKAVNPELPDAIVARLRKS